jgi:molybdopterin synthase catalytic subunit
VKVRISVQEKAFDSGSELNLLQQPGVGGVSVFVGVVRNMNDDDTVSGLYLEHYPGMTEKQIGAIIEEAGSRWDIKAATVIHRIGQLHPTDEIVFVGTAGAHRGEAFDACEFIIDYLKTRATFWKKETTTAGDRWLTTRESDVQTAQEWENN